MASTRQVAANRRNGLKGGVKTEEGKAISRLNARKHGIFACALTAEDSKDVCGIEDELIASLRPAGRVEEMLVEKLALTYLRMQRCARAEAEYHSRTWEEPNAMLERKAVADLEEKRRWGARAVPFKEQVFERMVKLIDLYDARLTNQFLKLIHEIERLQSLRKGEDAPPPVVADRDIQADAEGAAQTGSSDGTAQNDMPALSQASAPVPHAPPVVADLTVQADARTAVALPERPPAPTPEKSEVVDAKEADAPKAI